MTEKKDSQMSRRTLLTSIGAAGATFSITQLLGVPKLAFGEPGGVTNEVYGNSFGIGNSFMKPVFEVTLAQLRSMPFPNLTDVYYVTDEGKEGHFQYDADDVSSADNTGTIVVSSKGARFKRDVPDRIFNVRWFGAIGDGVHDDGAAIQAAIDAIPAGGATLLFPQTSQFYALESQGLLLENKQNVRLVGEGTTIKFKANTPDVIDQQRKLSILRMLSSRWVVMEGLILHGNLSQRVAVPTQESFHCCLNMQHCEDVVIENCHFIEGMTDGIYVGAIYNPPGSPPRTALVSKNIVINNCQMLRCRRNNISIVGADGARVSNCRISEAGTIQGISPRSGIDVEPNKGWFGTSKNIVLQNNTVENNAGTNGVSVGGSGSENVRIEGNRIMGHTTGLNLNNNANAPMNKNVVVSDNTFSNNINGMRMVARNVDIISGNLFVDNSSIGLIMLYHIDGVIVTQNQFIRNLDYAISGGYNSPNIENNIRSVVITNNLFADSVAESNNATAGRSVRLYMAGPSALVVFNNNMQLNRPDAVLKMKGAWIDRECLARATGNTASNLFDPTKPHERFVGAGNYSDALLIS